MESEAFSAGIARLEALLTERPTACMCAEQAWQQCHRGLISDYLKSRGVEVVHIVAAGRTQIHPFTQAARIVAGKLSYRAPTAQCELPF
jgi:uncharacterized protein (DUF488 family)